MYAHPLHACLRPEGARRVCKRGKAKADLK